MADPAELNQICNKLGVSREEGLYYFEGFDWDLASAMEACRIKTLPPVPDISSPAVSVTEKLTAAESSATPLKINSRRICTQDPSKWPSRMIDSRQVSNQVPNPPKEISSEVKKERIDQFRDVAYGLSLQEVVTFLDRFNWDVAIALDHHWEQKTATQYTSNDVDDHPAIDESYLQQLPETYIPMIGVSDLEGFSQDETSTALAVETMEHRGPPLPSIYLPSKSQIHASLGQIGSSSSSSGLMNVDVPVMSSSQVQIQESSSAAQIRKGPPPPCKVNSLPGGFVNVISAMQECESPTSTPVVLKSRRISNEMQIQPEQLPPKKEELMSESKVESIKKFCDVTRASPEFAVAYLDSCKWCVNDAINYFMEEPLSSKGDHSTMGQSNSQWPSEGDRSTTGFSEDVTSKALASGRRQNMCPPVRPMKLPSQSQFQASRSPSSSLMDVDPTETEEALKEASDESVSVAIPPLASSQVDGKLKKGKAVEEDSSTEAAQAAPKTITIDIIFHDGTTANIPFRFDQTVRDIRNVIEALRPDDSRDYYLMSQYADDYKDLNKTVKEITRGSTSFMQLYS